MLNKLPGAAKKKANAKGKEEVVSSRVRECVERSRLIDTMSPREQANSCEEVSSGNLGRTGLKDKNGTSGGNSGNTRVSGSKMSVMEFLSRSIAAGDDWKSWLKTFSAEGNIGRWEAIISKAAAVEMLGVDSLASGMALVDKARDDRLRGKKGQRRFSNSSWSSRKSFCVRRVTWDEFDRADRTV